MKIRARSIILGLVALVVLLVLGGITAIGWQIVLGPRMRPTTSRTFASTPERLARGKYIVEGPAHCFHCHTEPDLNDPAAVGIVAKQGSGWQMPIPELNNPYSANITSDVATGIGGWTDDEIARALQEGVDKQGRALFPLMPYMKFRTLTDEDVASIVVFLRTLPPISHAVPDPAWPFPLNLIVKTLPQPLSSHDPAPARTTAVARGEYLVNMAGCIDCHTPADDKGTPLKGMDFAGGALFHDPANGLKPIFSANITQDASGISHYDEALFVQTLQTGSLPGRALNPIMPFGYFRNMTEDDLKDVFAYVKTIAPVKHRLSNTDPPTKCPVCNQVHGLGDLNSK